MGIPLPSASLPAAVVREATGRKEKQHAKAGSQDSQQGQSPTNYNLDILSRSKYFL